VGRDEETGFQVEQRNWNEGKKNAVNLPLDFPSPIQGFRIPARDEGCGTHQGRCPKASREGTRERCAPTVPQALWGFGLDGSGIGEGIGVEVLLIAALDERV
jgi:hypothetical protein